MNLIHTNRLFNRDDFFYPIQQQFDKFFEDFFKDTNIDSVVATGTYPKVDIVTENEQLLVKAAIPGVNPDDLSVEITPENGRLALTISGKMSSEYQSPEGASYHVRELKKSSFKRLIMLPDWVKEDPNATFNDGMLILSWDLPKTQVPEAEPPPRRIEIKRKD